MPGLQKIATMAADHDMERVISGISSSRAHADPHGCINDLNPLIDTGEGRRFLSKQRGGKALVLIELFDWVVIVLFPYVSATGTENLPY